MSTDQTDRRAAIRMIIARHDDHGFHATGNTKSVVEGFFARFMERMRLHRRCCSSAWGIATFV